MTLKIDLQTLPDEALKMILQLRRECASHRREKQRLREQLSATQDDVVLLEYLHAELEYRLQQARNAVPVAL